MPSNFPSTVPIRYPLNHTVKVASGVVEFLDGSEQRWRSGPILQSLSLQLSNIPLSEVSDVLSWFEAVKGSYDSTWSITANGITYPSMGLEVDELLVTENRPTFYDITIPMRQTAQSGTWPSASAVFPGINGGRLTQRPWGAKTQFRTTRNDLEGGARFAYYEWPTPRQGWNLGFPCITLSELTTLMQFFVAMGGRQYEFQMTDPETGATFDHARFDTDEFSAVYVDPGHCSVALPITEIQA